MINGKLEALKYILKINKNIFDQKKKLKLNLKDKFGNTPLFSGIKNGNLETLQILLNENDILVNIRNEKDLNLFHYAAEHGKDEVLDLFMTHQKTKGLLHECNKNGQNSIYFSAKAGYLSSTIKLIRNGVDINHQDIDGNTPLHIAIQKKHFHIIKNLIICGAKTNVFNKKKDTPKKLINIIGFMDIDDNN
jgi:uncharacterized protein